MPKLFNLKYYVLKLKKKPILKAKLLFTMDTAFYLHKIRITMMSIIKFSIKIMHYLIRILIKACNKIRIK